MRFEFFLNIIEDSTSNYSKIKKEDYHPLGLFPIIDQGQGFIGGFTDDEKLISKQNLPVIVFGDHTKIFKFVDFPFTIGADGVKVLSLKNQSFKTKFYYYFLKTLRLTNAGYSRHYKYLKVCKLPVPENVDDQHRIANLLTKAENLLSQRKESIRLLDEYLKSTFLEMFGDPVRNEKSLKTIELGKLGNWKSGGTPSRKIDNFFKGDILWITSGELNEMYISNSKEKISKEAILNSNASEIQVGSLLLGMYDTAALKSSINRKIATCNQAIAFAKLDASLCDSIFIYYTIQIGKDYFRSQQRGVRQKNMNLSMIKGIKIILPPIEEQNKFAQIVEKTESIKDNYQKSLQELENLYSSLSQMAFRGELSFKEKELMIAAEPEVGYNQNNP